MGVLLVAALAASCGSVRAQGVETPNFWDQRQRIAAPDLGGRARIRFLTALDFPPFNFLDDQGRLAGLNVDLARAICEELEATAICQIEAKPFGELTDALAKGDGEAVAAGLGITADSRARFTFTHPFFRFPARFVVRRDARIDEPLRSGLDGIEIGVVGASAHEAMLRSFFPKAKPVEFDTRDNALEAVKAGRVRAVFGDGVGLSFWLSSDDAGECCAFAGGPYLSDRYLGEGLAIAVKPEDGELAAAFDYALGKIVESGRMSELLLRYFPVSAF